MILPDRPTITYAAAHDLASTFGLPGDATEHLWSALQFAQAVLYMEGRPKIQKQERELKKSRRADPNDVDLWAEEIMLHRWPRSKGKQPDHRLEAAVILLADIWKKYHGRIPQYEGRDRRAAGNALPPSREIQFLQNLLKAIGVHPTHLEPDPLRKRVARLGL